MSMIVVTIPLYLLYEFSILVCRKDEQVKDEPEEDVDDTETGNSETDSGGLKK